MYPRSLDCESSVLPLCYATGHNLIKVIIRNVERIDLTSFGRIFARPIVMAADLSRRHKSDDFNSFLIHLFF